MGGGLREEVRGDLFQKGGGSAIFGCLTRYFMEKAKPWQWVVIAAVVLLTLYNILPTLFYYSKPLSAPIAQERAVSIADQISTRVDALEEEGKEWLVSFAKLVGITSPVSVAVDPVDAGNYIVSFNTSKEADRFSKLLPRAGSYIQFVPAQLHLGVSNNPLQVVVRRNVGLRMEGGEWFSYVPMFSEDGSYSPALSDWVEDRANAVAEVLTGLSPVGKELDVWMGKKGAEADAFALNFSRELVDLEGAFGKGNPFLGKFLSRLVSGEGKAKDVAAKLELLSKEEGTAAENKKMLEKASDVLKRNQASIAKSTKQATFDGQHSLAINSSNPLFDTLAIDWTRGRISLTVAPDVKKILDEKATNERGALVQEKLRQLLVQEIALLQRITGEKVELTENGEYSVAFSPLDGTSSFLAMDLEEVAEALSAELENTLKTEWQPRHADFALKNYPVVKGEHVKELNDKDKSLSLWILNPLANDPSTEGLNKGSIYVVARGARKLLDAALSQSQEMQEVWKEDIEALRKILEVRGFVGYPGDVAGMPKGFEQDIVFENPSFASYLLAATRENFEVVGNKRLAMLPLSTVGERIARENAIDDQIQDDLLKSKEEWQSSSVSIDPLQRLTVPEPAKSPFWENVKLSMKKYFRGDERRVLKWGLDLSGGKAVRVGLVDHSGRPVTDPEDLKQAVNELYSRINRLGVSEQTIRVEDSHILVEFPGSQHLSAEELIQASAMTFHVINEKFSYYNPELREAVDAFLQEVWNEAVVTQKTDIDSLQEIAWKRLGGDLSDQEAAAPRGSIAELLYREGLKIAPPSSPTSSVLDDTFSSIGKLRGNDRRDWGGLPTPLVIMFHNYALEGASLSDVQVGYDSNKGNMLGFSIKNRYDNALRAGNPQDDLYAWSSRFSEESIAGTQLEKYSDGRGWRMAVVLNGEIVSAPSLSGTLRDSGSITGRFSQREINKLAADLKAGSLTFTPKILSETNISPELGKEERAAGFRAAIIALLAVVVAMVSYYRFAGVIASVAVLFNLLILWGVLQNIDAALTLPGIAGIVLTIGMAVDANVLVFERIKEELKNSGRLASAIHAGYNKAYSAIVDSNLTTIIAALILTQFDSGPIKGFAITLIIGVVSSMFTALFMTRAFFNWWVQRGGKTLNMSSLFGGLHYPFLSKSRLCIALSVLLIALGSIFFVQQRQTLFGMDFTGGYSLIVDTQSMEGQSPRLTAKEALEHAGALANEVDVRELSRPTQLRIQLGKGMDEPGRPFYNFSKDREDNPRLEWVLNALNKGGVSLVAASPQMLTESWSEVSGQFSQGMQKSAIYAILIALAAILIYITIRFEWKYALASVIGLVHDLLLTLALLAIFHALGFPVEIDLVVVGALMTIIGYSLNNTIIIFDRVREDLKLMRKSSFYDVITHALNETLSRTILTSGTTLLVLLALLLLGGSALFGFSLVMALGVFFGTLSSLFIAPYILYQLAMKEEAVNNNKGTKPSRTLEAK